MITVESKVKKVKEIESADLNNEKVMINMEKGKYYALNEIGSRIYEMIEDDKSINDIIDNLLNVYDVDRNVCEKSVIKYLSSLYNAGIIYVSEDK